MKQSALVFALSLALTGIVSAHDLAWAPGSDGTIPEGALVAGHEQTKEVLFVCRAKHAGGIHIGKIRSAFGGCNIPYAGQEIAKRNYEVLVHQ